MLIHNNWNYETEPFIVRWATPHDARLRSFTHRIETFPTKDAAFAAIALPFLPHEVNAHIAQHGLGIIATRNRDKKLRRK